MANAFQQGQAAQLDIEKAALANEAAASTQTGINALADIFGETARAPREKVALETAASREEQRGIENVRQKRQDELAEQKIDTVRRARAGRQTVAFIKQGLKNGASMEEIMAKAGPAIQALGATEEEIGQLPQMIADDPAVLDQFEAAFRATEKAVTRRAIGRPVPIRQADGTAGMLQSFSDGSQVFTEGATTLAAEQAGERVVQAGERVAVAQKKIDPGLRGSIKAREEAEKTTVARIDEALTEARNAEVALDNSVRALELIDEGIRTGSFGSVRQEASRFFADILGLPQDAVPQTDEFFARMGLEVAGQIKAFGAGTGLSDADREFASKIVGGSIALDEDAIRNLVNMRRKVNAKLIRDYNRDRDAFVGEDPRLQKLYPSVRKSADNTDELLRKYGVIE